MPVKHHTFPFKFLLWRSVGDFRFEGPLVGLYRAQTSQLSRFHRETHGFGPYLTVSRLGPNFSL